MTFALRSDQTSLALSVTYGQPLQPLVRARRKNVRFYEGTCRALDLAFSQSNRTIGSAEGHRRDLSMVSATETLRTSRSIAATPRIVPSHR